VLSPSHFYPPPASRLPHPRAAQRSGASPDEGEWWRSETQWSEHTEGANPSRLPHPRCERSGASRIRGSGGAAQLRCASTPRGLLITRSSGRSPAGKRASSDSTLHSATRRRASRRPACGAKAANQVGADQGVLGLRRGRPLLAGLALPSKLHLVIVIPRSMSMEIRKPDS
jgi:hypothetical protein